MMLPKGRRLLLPTALLLLGAHSSLASGSPSRPVAVSCKDPPSSWAHNHPGASSEVTCGQRISFKSEERNFSGIIGGEFAAIIDFPWQVGIFKEGNHLCGGTILSEWWILSASHCFENLDQSDLTVIGGVDDLNTTNLKNVEVDKLIMHPYFDGWILDNDIALLLLKCPLNLGVNEVPICLSEVSDINAWKNCWVTGWGTTGKESTKMSTPKLQKVNVQLVSWDKCFHSLPLLTKNMLCAGNPIPEKDACQGDSGGPLVCTKKRNKAKWYQVGIVSWGVDCGKNRPGAYTKVSRYLQWINSATAQAGKPYMHKPHSGYSLPVLSSVTLFLHFVMLLVTW